MLLLHGLSQTAWSWAPVARRLCRTMHVVAIDLRGHGVSEAPRDGYDLDSLAYDVLTVAVANGWGRGAGGQPCIVVGHGLGAMVAATAGLLEPDSVAGVGLIDAGWDDLAEATGLTAEEFLRGLAEPPEVMRSMTAYLDDRRDYDPASWDDDQERAARAAVDEKHAGHVAPVLRAHAQRALVEAMFEYRPRHAIRQLSMPLLVCVAEAGAADDGQVRERRLALNESLALREAAGLSPALVVRFPGVGHNLM
ncbi:MAG: alpha/beta fold hydrolase, partial [Chloroflexi bacterium]|nr:alpha/beta fold hydrolase [Chloroflexota bacterium]